MSESNRIQVVRNHQKIEEYAFRRENIKNSDDDEKNLDSTDYSALGIKRLAIIKSLPFKENWPFTVGNVLGPICSGFLAGSIAKRMATNLSLSLTNNLLGTVGGPWFVTTSTHLVAYYFGVLRKLCSDDPLLCPACLEIRSFAIGSLVPVVVGTTTATLGNLSSILLRKTIQLPPFHIKAYREWQHLFQKYAFNGMAHRHFLFYPLLNGFLTSMIFFGHSYVWQKNFRDRVLSVEAKNSPSVKSH